MNIETAMNNYLEGIKKAYAEFQKGSRAWSEKNGDDLERLDRIQKDMYERFAESVGYTVGKKYIRVVKDGSVHSFIVATDNDKNFKYGDILKPAGWKAPARNFARGNVFETVNPNWTGA